MTTRPRFTIEPSSQTLAIITSPHQLTVQFISLQSSFDSFTVSASDFNSSSPFTSVCVFQENSSKELFCTLANLDKALYIYDIQKRELINELRTKKRIMASLHVEQTHKLYFADKFGDVWSLDEKRMREKPPMEKPKQQKGKKSRDFAHTDDNDNMTLELGHLATLTDMALSSDGKFLITADRDEKIRVSHFPKTHEIWSFCLGHKQCVTCVAEVDVPGTDSRALVSSSLDGTLKVWEYSNEYKPLRFTHTVQEGAYPVLVRSLGNFVAVCNEKANEIQYFALHENYELLPLEGVKLNLHSEVLHFEFVQNGEYLMVLVADAPNVRVYRVKKQGENVNPALVFEQDSDKYDNVTHVSFELKADSDTYISSMKKANPNDLAGRHKRGKDDEKKEDEKKEVEKEETVAQEAAAEEKALEG
eukprot:CAMPEP_0117449992 /NCGR_PEP_ID=MMETSP0759-20121206/8234_1 /TAXON_ID=63605 /ORGANISM="Percolomonas cosmopolitus, Strain WS" /LENGTH=417 /DNA_ID=CAMNT_0005242491 /DNA_START=7 /DNA_END=1260 /DNA_ORIENTATION=+